MAWDGYFVFGGTEIINVQRTEKYAAHLPWFKPAHKCLSLGPALGEAYTTPWDDDAPWYDPDDQNSNEFYGLYPLSITGIEDSTVTAPVTESTGDGGVVGRARRATRAVVFSGVLIATSDCGAEYGMRWLRSALTGQACGSTAFSSCAGSELCFLSCAPCHNKACPPPGLPASGVLDIDDISRTLRRVTVTTGPTVVNKASLPSGGEAWTVTFTAVAGNPVEFGFEKPYLTGFMDPTVAVPFPGGNVPPGASWDSTGYSDTDSPCPTSVYTPVYDPDCPVVIPPPPVPSVDLSCFYFPTTFKRRLATIAESEIPLWGEVVPILKISAMRTEVRSLRIRFYADVTNTGTPDADPCGFCGDLLVSYIPLGSTLVLDAADKVVYVESGTQGRRRADSLVYASDGTPFEWPELSCGIGYVVTFDMPTNQTPPRVDLSLTTKVA